MPKASRCIVVTVILHRNLEHFAAGKPQVGTEAPGSLSAKMSKCSMKPIERSNISKCNQFWCLSPPLRIWNATMPVLWCCSIAQSKSPPPYNHSVPLSFPTLQIKSFPTLQIKSKCCGIDFPGSIFSIEALHFAFCLKPICTVRRCILDSNRNRRHVEW